MTARLRDLRCVKSPKLCRSPRQFRLCNAGSETQRWHNHKREDNYRNKVFHFYSDVFYGRCHGFVFDRHVCGSPNYGSWRQPNARLSPPRRSVIPGPIGGSVERPSAPRLVLLSRLALRCSRWVLPPHKPARRSRSNQARLDYEAGASSSAYSFLSPQPSSVPTCSELSMP